MESPSKDIVITKYAYIDALRGFAILAVVFYHSALWVAPTSRVLSKIAEQGARGVQFFFVASALTLFLSLGTRKKIEARPITNFFIRRFFRIAPLFYVAIIVYMLYDGNSARYFAPNGIQWWFVPLTALFLNGWLPETINSVVPGGWSIAVEMIFYLTVPYLFSKLKDVNSTLRFIFASLVIAKLLSLLAVLVFAPFFQADQQYLVTSFSDFWFFSQLPVFTTGILLYHVVTRYPGQDKQLAFPLLLISLFLFITFLQVNTFENLLPENFLYGTAFFLFALSLHFFPQKLFVNKVTTFIGKISFSIYLVHFMVLKIVGTYLPEKYIIQGNIGFVIAFFIVMVLSIGASYITYKVIELPGINLGKRVIGKFSKQIS